MALVKCPECGREKVSDKALACPDCGFGLKEYFENKNNLNVLAEADSINYEDAQKIEADCINKEWEERNRREEERLKSLSQLDSRKDATKQDAMDRARWEAQYNAKIKEQKQVKKMIIAAISGIIVIGIIIYIIGNPNKTNNHNYISSTSKLTNSASKKNNVSIGRQNALKSAKAYLNSNAFSKKGLISQLIFEGYSEDEANYAVENCKANWKEEAAKRAKAYLSVSSFSRSGLIDQLEYEGFTKEEAEYGVSKNGY